MTSRIQQTHHELKIWLNSLQARQNIRDKYGIEKKQPTKKSDKQTAAMMEELRKEYGMDDEDAKELQNKMDKVIRPYALCTLWVWWRASPENIGQPEYHDIRLSGCCWARCSQGESGTKDGGAGHISQNFQFSFLFKLNHQYFCTFKFVLNFRWEKWRRSWRRILVWTSASSSSLHKSDQVPRSWWTNSSVPDCLCQTLAQCFKELIVLGWIDIGQILQLTWKWEPDLFEIWFVLYLKYNLID